MSKPYTWLLFDADDTLFDYTAAETNTFQNTFRDFALPCDATTLEQYRTLNHRLWLQLERREITSDILRTHRFELLFQALQLELPPTLSDTYIEQLGAQTHLNEGALEMLQTLAPHHKIAIITNGMERVQLARLARSEIQSFISEIIISEQVGHAKPAREIFDAAFTRMGQPKREQVLLIGDSLSSDMQGGISYQIDTCWYNPKQLARPADLAITREIHHLRELSDWLA